MSLPNAKAWALARKLAEQCATEAPFTECGDFDADDAISDI
jgi:hypothetical protein